MARTLSSRLDCPACGGPITGISPVIRSISCGHCGNLLYFNNTAWQSGGKFPTDIDAPPLLRVDRLGKLAGEAFRVAGRIRLEYDHGHWDEWWLEFESGEDRWLEEDDGTYQVHHAVPIKKLPGEMESLGAGQMLAASGQNWFITESGKARVSGAEGQLPVTLQPGFELRYFDAVGDGKEISIEVWGNEVEASISKTIDPASFNWSD